MLKRILGPLPQDARCQMPDDVNTTFFKEPNIVRVLANANYLSKLAIWQASIASNFVDRRLTKFLDSDEISAFVLDLPSIRDTNARNA